MAICLVAVKFVRERNHEKTSRLGKSDRLPPPENDMVSDDDEVAYLKRGILLILLTGLLPPFAWLCLHLLLPELLQSDISPKTKLPSSHSIKSDVIRNDS